MISARRFTNSCHFRMIPEGTSIECATIELRSCGSEVVLSLWILPFIEKRYHRDVEHARARALYRFRSGLLAGPAIQNNNPDHGRDHQRATESRCQCPVIYCRDLHVCRLGGAANAICEVGHKATANFADPRRGSGIDVTTGARPCLHTPIDLIVGHLLFNHLVGLCEQCGREL